MGETEKKDKKNFFRKLSVKMKVIFILVLLVVGAVAAYFIYDVAFVNKGHEVTTISTSTLEDIIQIEELSTVDYTYNSIATVYVDGSDKVKYYVAYDGIVKAGINFSKVQIALDEETKKITVTIPEVEIQDVIVEIESLDFIFTKDKYETETVLQEAYKICIEDLQGKVNSENALFTMARENAKETIKALIEPWIEQVDNQYVVEIN